MVESLLLAAVIIQYMFMTLKQINWNHVFQLIWYGDFVIFAGQIYVVMYITLLIKSNLCNAPFLVNYMVLLSLDTLC